MNIRKDGNNEVNPSRERLNTMVNCLICGRYKVMWGSGEMADAHALGACALTGVWVRIPPSPPIKKTSWKKNVKDSDHSSNIPGSRR